MKRIIVNTNQAALVFRKGELIKVLKKGLYWLGFGEKAEILDMSKPFPGGHSSEALLQHPDFAAAVKVIEVSDHELVLFYQDKLFREVLAPGRYIYWKGLNNTSFTWVDTMDYRIADNVERVLLSNPALYPFIRVFNVGINEKGLLFADGKFREMLEPGNYFFWKNNTTIQVINQDTRMLNMELAGQEILTKDKAQLRINFHVQYRVSDIMKALLENKEFEKQLYIMVQLALREFIGKLTFDELMESKEEIAGKVLAIAGKKAEILGVSITDCGLKDIILPGDVREIMNQVLIAEKKAQATIITRREETASTKSLLNTARLMEDNVMLCKLKEMEYVEKIAEKIHTISLSGGSQVADQLKQLFLAGTS